MAVDNTAIGSALIIPDGLLNNLKQVDKKIKDIQDTSRATSNVFNNSFASMSMGLKTGILTQLQQVINQLGSVGQAAQTASSATQNMGSGLGTAAQGATNLGTSVTGVVEAINRMIGQLQQTGQVGSSSLMAAKLAADKLMEAMKYDKAGGDIANLKSRIESITSALNDTEHKMSKARQDALVEQKRRLQEELKEAERTQNERAVNLQRVLDRMMRAEQSYQRQVEQARKKTAQDYQKQNYASNTTYSGSLSFADNANTINRRTQAIKYLTEARNALSKTDADYIDKLATLNAKIKELNAANRQAIASSQELNNSHRKLMDTAGQLQRAFALMFSVSQIRGYIGQIAKVRGEFELQQKSLQAILQNKTKADEIFNKTMALAVDSPFRAKQLITYTKQLAAYRIENDKLYDTTKRLADVSAGLGVDMQRLILAYGQVKAAAYLRGTEVRQFTEAGINLYGELQRLFKERDQADYTTAQIVDMISKRMVTFEDVEQIFKRITDQGGLFYNMQHIQVETLAGKIGKLKDVIDQMMNSVGKENEGLFKGSIDAAIVLLNHWEAVVNVGKALVGVLIAMKLQSALTNKELLRMLIMSKIAKDGTKMASVVQVLQLGFMKLTKSIKTTVSGLGLFIKTNPILAAATVLAAGLYEVYSHFSEINEALDENKRKYEEAIQPINALTAEYIQLANAMKSAKEAGDTDFDFGENRKGRESIIRKIADELEKENIKIDLSNLGALNDKQLQSKSEELIKRYKGIKKSVQEMSNAYSKLSNEVEGWFGLFGDNIKTDMEDLKRSEADVLSGGASITAQLNLLGANYNKLSENAKKYYDTVKGGQNIKAGESEVEYLERVHKAISEIMKLDWGKSVIEELQNMAIKANIDWEAFRKDKNNFLDEVRKMKADFEKQGITDPWDVAVAINTVASENNWSEYEKNIAKREFKVPLVFDQQKIDEQIDTIDKQLKRAFDNKTYNVTIKTNGLDFLSASKEEKKTMDVQLARLKELVAERDRANRATIKLDNYDALQVNAEISTLKKQLTAAGYDLSSIFGTNKNKSAAKAQRDILSEQIEAYKDLQSQYEKYLKIYDAETAKAKALESLKNKLQNAGIYKDAAGIVPDEKTITERIKNIASKFKDIQKRGNAYKVVADFEYNIDKKDIDKKLENIKDEVEKAFKGLTLNTKLTDLGLHSYDIDKLFPGLKKSVNDVRNTIYREFSMTPEMLNLDDAELKLKMGEELYKEYTSAINKLNQQEVEEQRRNVEQLVKDYKNQLDSQLQIDLWYAREREKIDKNISESTLRSEMYSNLEKKYKEKSDENEWESFKNSNAYINIFGNLENASKQTLDYLYKRLEDVKSSLHNLSPENLKEVVEAMNKINTEQVNRNPFKGLTKNIKEYIKYLKEKKKLEQERNSSMTKEQELASEAKRQNSTVEFYEKQYELAQKLYGEKAKYDPLAKKEISDAEKILKQAREKLNVTKKAQKAQKEVTESKDEELGKGEKAGENTKKAIQDIGKYASQAATAVRGIGDAFGGLSGEAEVAVDVLDNIGQAIGNFYAGNYGGMVANAAGAISGIVQLFSGDIRRREQIADLSAEISKLQNAFERLEKSMNDAWSLSSLEKYKSEAVEDLELMNKKLEQMIQLERDCKNPDEGKITEWENQIQDNLDTITELAENFREVLGGLGSESNYKSAAQEFADAWFEAFNEGSNTLDALNKQFDQLIENLVKKQLMLRVTDQFLKPIFELIDKTVSADGKTAGGVEQLKAGLAQLNLSKDNWLEGADEYMKVLADFFGISPNADSALSALQQGIQGITEDTASALESLLNSMRFFLATQQADVAVIKDYLLSRGEVTNDSGTTSPMLTELKNQTMVLRNIQSMWDRVIKPMQGGWGLRVIGIS